MRPVPVLTALILSLAVPASAGATEAAADRPGFSLFGERGNPFRPAPREAAPERVQMAQVSAADLLVRIDRLEGQIRQLNGTVEQLQFRNRELETQLKRFQEDVEFRFQEQRGGAPRAQPAPQAPRPAAPPAAGQPGQPRPQQRGDAFDPTAQPGVAGQPRTLGSVPAGTIMQPEPPVGAPGGRDQGAPLDIGTLASRATNDPTLAPGSLPPPPPRNPAATGAGPAPPLPAVAPPGPVAAAAPVTPRDQYDLAYGSILRQDFPAAEQQFRDFVRRNPNDRQVGDAHFWIGESLFQRQRFKDAADSFLTVSTRHGRSSKAPDALLRLGQSLAALNEKDAACATFAEVERKHPNASANVRASVAREQQRARC
jgi:tol-pal system protein YbgF